MLTIYEQIQESIDFIEANLFEGVTSDTAASSACMSVRSFHRYFPALTGYRFGEYVRKRRLSEAMSILMGSEDSVLEIALHAGYDSHEAFTRVFKQEFGVAPLRFRTSGRSAAPTEKLDIVGEVNMGVLTRLLPEMTVACFDGFKPEPEQQAHRLMTAWMSLHPEAAGSHRLFGHNIDTFGFLSHGPDNDGYRLMVTLPDEALPLGPGAHLGTIDSGVFVVTGIEGSFDDDPSGSWVVDGWKRLQVMMQRQGIHEHPSHRWFEEWLAPVTPGRTRFDLYVEIERPPGGLDERIGDVTT